MTPRQRFGARNSNHMTTTAPTLNQRTRLAIASSSLIFSILQSICTVAVTISGIRLAVGAGALAFTSGLGYVLESFHKITWLRIALLIGALLGALVSLWIVFRARKLRNRPAAHWRMRPLSPAERRGERLQIAISVTTLILIFIEEYLHFRLCHTL